MSPFELHSLPPHIIRHIVSFCENPTLCALARTDRILQDLAERLIWQSLDASDDNATQELLREHEYREDNVNVDYERVHDLEDLYHEEQGRFEDLIQAWSDGLHARPQRGTWVQTLRAEIHQDEDVVLAFAELLKQLCSSLVRLDLRVEPWVDTDILVVFSIGLAGAVFPRLRHVKYPMAWFPGWQERLVETLRLGSGIENLELQFDKNVSLETLDPETLPSPRALQPDLPTLSNLHELMLKDWPGDLMPDAEKIITCCPALRHLTVRSIAANRTGGLFIPATRERAIAFRRFKQIQQIDWVEADGSVCPTWYRSDQEDRGEEADHL